MLVGMSGFECAVRTAKPQPFLTGAHLRRQNAIKLHPSRFCLLVQDLNGGAKKDPCVSEPESTEFEFRVITLW